ncbi:hypothetical protein [Microvirga massiliensis]|uniref:hypothetical protein n=1 Tax=Microvirga massiliensis TaxID=1033741 RepID=UPI00164D2391|nr:hypothetical protein [Microvirga massiliensis]
MPRITTPPFQAAGRLKQRYPTVAIGSFPTDELIEVGTYDAQRWTVRTVDDPDALSAWAGEAIEKITGVRLPVGYTDWATAARASEGVRPVGNAHGGRHYTFLTKAGQVIVFDPLERRGEILADDDPRLDDLFPSERHAGPRP